MKILEWSIVGTSALLFGVCYAQYLTVDPVRMSCFQFAINLSAFVAILTILWRFRGLELWIALALTVGLALVGYAWMTGRVLARDDPRSVSKLVRQPDDPGLGHTAVVYFTHGEPETYDPIGWINQFREFDEQGIRFVPFLARPFFITHLRKIYLTVGRSNHRRMHQQMLRSLEQAFRAAGDTTTQFYLCFLDDDPRPDAAVVAALNEGASQIVVSEVFLTISNHTAEGKTLIRELPLEEYGVPIVYTGPLWDSELLQQMFVARVNAHRDGTDKEQIGVLLVGHGQPDEWDEAWPTETAQEIAFRENVLKLFESDGYLISKAHVPEGVELINLGAWNDYPWVIRAIKAKIDVVSGTNVS
jgi:sirohydrochlorin ferrochelatase